MMTEDMVAHYLKDHPDLLQRRPELLIALDIPHGAKGTVSLVERQRTMLRAQIAAERQRLSCLVERAREYESLANHLHELTIKLILARDFQHIQDILDAELRIEFNAEAVALLRMPQPEGTPPPEHPPTDFRRLVELEQVQCGPLSAEHYAELFGKTAAGLQSAALIPLKGPKMRALLAIASRDADRFTADMSTHALERLAEIISAKLIELALLHHE